MYEKLKMLNSGFKLYMFATNLCFCFITLRFPKLHCIEGLSWVLPQCNTLLAIHFLLTTTHWIHFPIMQYSEGDPASHQLRVSRTPLGKKSLYGWWWWWWWWWWPWWASFQEFLMLWRDCDHIALAVEGNGDWRKIIGVNFRLLSHYTLEWGLLSSSWPI